MELLVIRHGQSEGDILKAMKEGQIIRWRTSMPC